MYRVIAFRALTGSSPYGEFIQAVRRSGNRTALRNFQAATNRLSEHGLALLNSSMMDNIEDDIYELRVGPYRVFCLYDRESNAFVLLHGFRKQTQKNPEGQKIRARALANQYLDSRDR